MNSNNKEYKSGFLGLIGQPNAGKSTLMNFLVDQKVSIVTPKPQTTRRRIIGIHTEDQGQIVFVDAPGLVKAASGLNSFLQKEIEDVVKSSDALIAVLSIEEDAVEKNEEIIKIVTTSKKPWLAVITKVDITTKAHRTLILKDKLADYGVDVIPFSVPESEDEDKADLIQKCFKILPQSPAPLFDPEMYTTESVRALCEEIVREKCFEVLSREVPYQIAVQTRKFDEDATPCPKIHIDIIVAKESQKPIVVGKAGANIKKIGEMSRKEIEKSLDFKKIFLDLNVTVVENWFEKNKKMKELKYVIDGE